MVYMNKAEDECDPKVKLGHTSFCGVVGALLLRRLQACSPYGYCFFKLFHLKLFINNIIIKFARSETLFVLDW